MTLTNLLLTEGSVFAPNAASPSDLTNFFRNNYPLLTANDTASILSHYPLLPPLPAHNAWFPTASRAYGEATFICPQHNILTYLHSRSGPGSASKHNNNNNNNWNNWNNSKLYAYRYNVHDDGNAAQGLGVPHVFDAPAIFGPDALGPGGGGAAFASYKTYNARVVPLVGGYWLSFVRALDPNAYRMAGAPRWGEWGGGGGEEEEEREKEEKGRLVVETEGARMEGVDGAEEERCAFWAGLGRGRMEQR